MNKITYFFKLWLKRIGRKNGYVDYITTYSWLEEDEIAFTSLLALAED